MPVAAIRQAAKISVEETSLRSVARAVDLSPMGLKNFVDGREPYTATARKLNAWFLRWAEGRPEYQEDVIQASLAALTEWLPDEERARASEGILRLVREGHERSKTPPPAWLTRLSRKIDPAPGG